MKLGKLPERMSALWYLYDRKGSQINTYSSRANARAEKATHSGSYLQYRTVGELVRDTKS